MRLVLTKQLLLTASTMIAVSVGLSPCALADPEPTSITANPHDALVMIEEGDRLFHADNLSESIAMYRKAVHAAPLNSTAHERLARALSLNDSLVEAEQEAKQAV